MHIKVHKSKSPTGNLDAAGLGISFSLDSGHHITSQTELLSTLEATKGTKCTIGFFSK